MLLSMKKMLFCLLLLLSFSLITKSETHDELSNVPPLLESELSLISNGESVLKMSIDSLLNLVSLKKISSKQAKIIWETIYSASNEKPLNDSLDFQDEKEKEQVQESGEERNSMGFYQLMLIMFVGYVIVEILVGFFLISLYLNSRHKTLFALLLFLSYNMMLLAQSLQDSMEANFLSAIIYDTIFLNLILSFHIVLIKLGIQSILLHVSEIINMEINRKGKICIAIFGLSLGYLFSFACVSPFVQLPFYFFLLYAVNVLRSSRILKFPKTCQPDVLFSFSMFSFLLFGYLYLRGAESFHEWLFLLQKIDVLNYLLSFIVQKSIIHSIDFRFFGYLLSLLIIISIFPLYLFVQNQNMGSNDLSFDNLMFKLKEELAKEKLEFNSSRVYFLVYAVIVVFSVVFTLRERFLLGTFISLFCLVNLLNMSLRNEDLSGKVVSFAGGFFLLSSIHLVSLLEDQFSPQLISDMREGYIVYFLDLFLKVIFHYFSIDIISASSYKATNEATNPDENEEENKEDKIQEKFSALNMVKSLVAHIVNYLFVVFFIAISEEEPSNILSFLCVIFAFLLFLKLLIYSYTTKEETNRIIIAVFIYLAGVRFSMLSFGNLNTPLYFGNILSNFSVCVSYFTIKTRKFQYVNIILLVGLFIQAFAVNSSFGLIVAIVNLFAFLTVLLSSKHKDKRNGVLLFLGIITLMLWALSGFNLNSFFNIIEFVMQMLPKFLCNWLFKIFEQTLLPEQILMKGVLKTIKVIMLSAEFQ